MYITYEGCSESKCTCQLIPWSRGLLDKLIVAQLAKKFHKILLLDLGLS
jgi:hypothetical protein